MKLRNLVLLVVIGVALLAVTVFSAVPMRINYQGSYTENGTPVTGNRSFVFKIVNSDGSSVYWTSGSVTINLQNGLFNYVLEPTGVNWREIEPYFEVRVGPSAGEETLLSPRERINASAYAIYASSASYAFNATIADNAVTNTKLRDSGPLSVIGRSTNSTGDPADISATAASGAVLRESGSTIGFGTVATAGIANDAVTFAKMQNIATASLIGRATAGTGDPENLTLGNGLSISGTSIVCDAASDTVDGIVELATAAETTTGTDATRAVTPDGFAGSVYGKRVVCIKVIGETVSLTTGDGQAYFTVPTELNGYNLVDADASVYTYSTSGLPTIQIARYRSGVSNDMLSTKITIDLTEYTSYTAATQPVINTSYDDVQTGDFVRVDVDVAGTGTKGLDVILSFQLP